MKLSLEVIKGPETGRKFEFTQPDTFIVGRGGKDRPVHFKLSDDDPYVSSNTSCWKYRLRAFISPITEAPIRQVSTVLK